MLRVERDVMEALLGDADPDHAEQVAAWVGGSLADMPELLRLGVLAESMLVAFWRRLRPSQDLLVLLDAMERNPIGLIQQYPRLFRSLVLFGDIESAPAAQ